MGINWNNIVDVYTNYITANKSSLNKALSSFKYFTFTHSSIFFGKFFFFITVRYKSAHIPLEVSPSW